MADGRPINFSLTADDRDLYNKLVKQEKQIDRLQQKYRALKKSMKESSDEGIAGFLKLGNGTDKVTLSVTDMVQAFVGISGAMGAINLVIGKVQELIEKQREAKRLASETNVTMDQARNAALLNLPTTFEGGTAEFDRMMKRVSERSGMTMAEVYRNAGGPLSAKGSATNPQFEDAFALALEVQRKTGGAVQSSQLAGSILDVMKSTGLGTAAESLGYIRQIGAASRVQTLEGQLKLVPGLAIGRSLGDSPEMSAELQAAISQQIVDPEGSRTGVLYKGLATALYSDDLIPYETSNVRTGKKETKFRKISGSNTLERLRNLASVYQGLDETGKKELVSKLSERQISFLLPALQGDPSFEQNLRSARAEISAPGKGSAVFTKKMLNDMGNFGGSIITDMRSQNQLMAESISAKKTPEAIDYEAMQYFKMLNERGGRANLADIMGFETMSLKTIGREFAGPGFGRGTFSDAAAGYIAANPGMFDFMSEDERNQAINLFNRAAGEQRRLTQPSEADQLKRTNQGYYMASQAYDQSNMGYWRPSNAVNLNEAAEALNKFSNALKTATAEANRNKPAIDPNRNNMDR